MSNTLPRLRRTLAGGAAVLALAVASNGAQAETGKRLAFSQRLGVEVFAVGGTDWCKEQTTVQILADSKDIFTRSDFEALIKSIGTRVLPTECPAAKSLVISGVEKSTGAIAWTGKAEGAAWKPEPGKPPGGDGPDKGNEPKDNPDKDGLPPPPVLKSPLGGEWTGEVGCRSWGQTVSNRVTLSVYEVDGSRFKAIWDVKPSEGNIVRAYVDGVYDDLANQIQFATPQKGAIRGGYQANVRVQGAFNPKANRLTINGLCGGDQSPTLTHASTTALTAHRVQIDAARRTNWNTEERRRPQDHRLVGKLPAGSFRVPSCAELSAWAGSFPVEQRVRLFPNSNGLLRHYDDATTQRVFGSPAYYWLGAEDENGHTAVQLNDIAYKVCGSAYNTNDPAMRMLATVVRDYASVNEMRDRRRYDDVLATLAPYLATLGDEPTDAVAGLNRFATMGEIEKNIGEFNLNASYLLPEDKTALVRSVDRYKKRIADTAGETKVRDIAAVPATFDGLAQVAKIRREFVALFGDTAAAGVAKTADDRRLAIAKALVNKAVEELGTTPRNFDGMMDAELKTSDLRDRLKGDAALEPLLRDLDAAESRFRTEARESVIRSEQEAIAAVPASVDGARKLTEHAKELEKALGKDAGPSFAAYQKAVTAKVGEIGTAVLPEIKAELSSLPMRWSSIGEARSVAAGYAAAFGGTPAAAAIVKEGEIRTQAILAALADQAVLDVKGTQGDGLKGVDQVMAEAAKAARAFADVEGGAPHAARIREAGKKRADEIADAYLPEFRSEVKNAPVSRATAIQMAAASLLLEQMAKEVPAMAKLRDVARDGAVAMYAGVCDKAIADAGISTSDGKTELLVGSEISTLKQFVCDLREGGIRAVKFETPGLMKSITGGDKQYVLRTYAAEDRVLRAAEGMVSRAFLGGTPRFGSRDELFDFGGAQRSEKGADKTVESPGKIVFKEMEVRERRNALVGVQIGDDAKTESLSLKQWREASAAMSALAGGGIDQGKLCASWAKGNVQEIGPYNAGLAMLTCAPKK